MISSAVWVSKCFLDLSSVGRGGLWARAQSDRDAFVELNKARACGLPDFLGGAVVTNASPQDQPEELQGWHCAVTVLKKMAIHFAC